MAVKLRVIGGSLEVEFPEGSLVEEARRQLSKAVEKEDTNTKDGIKKAGETDGNKYIPQLDRPEKLPI